MARRPRRSAAATAADPLDPAGPKTTRPESDERRPLDAANPIDREGRPKLDAVPDRVDIRDWFYQPRLFSLPSQVVNIDRVPLILDQAREGACTGFALAAVINFLLAGRFNQLSVSPRMLYEMARRYDEWPGEGYDGSSARGAMKGWVRHGVCLAESWPPDLKGPQHLSEWRAQEARSVPGGAFYRVMHREVRDVHAAIAEVGAVFATLMVHEGWFLRFEFGSSEPEPAYAPVVYFEGGDKREIALPIIRRRGRATGGHAVAIIGYTRDGFIVQNSWGEGWGTRGFALLPYEDYLLHATDVWVAQLGVPVSLDLWSVRNQADTAAGLQRAASIIPLADIRPYVVDIGNDGRLSDSGDYWTTEGDLQELFTETIASRFAEWSGTAPGPVEDKRRVMIFIHGGLNDEAAVARRIIAYRDVFEKNLIYPLHIMWETGLVETTVSMLEDLVASPERAEALWLDRLRDGLREARDWTIEMTVALPGGALWREMKENARRSTEGLPGGAAVADGRSAEGAVSLIARHAAAAIAELSETDRSKWEIHLVAHSAGANYAAYALSTLLGSGLPLKSVQLLAPAITVEEFERLMLPKIDAGECPLPLVYMLSDTGERDDKVGPYGKSLLYLVSNAFEGRRDTPLLGMERYARDPREALGPDWDGLSGAEKRRLEDLVDRKLAARLKGRLIVAGESYSDDRLGSGVAGPRRLSEADSHGGFDNDVATMNSVLEHMLGRKPNRPFNARDLQF